MVTLNLVFSMIKTLLERLSNKWPKKLMLIIIKSLNKNKMPKLSFFVY